MPTDYALFGTAFAALFAMMNPMANTPVFLSLTSEIPKDETRAIALRSVALAFIIATVFAFTGNYILHLFGISLSAFRIAGGALIALVGYHLLQGNHSPVQKPSTANLNDAASREASLGLAVSPLAMPILAGPGTLVTIMSFTAQSSINGKFSTLAAFAIICIITYLCFIGGNALVKLIGHSALMVISRIMGLILAVIGVQMLIEGIKTAFNIA